MRPESEAYPIALELDRCVALRVRWMDGHKSTYPLDLLRRACPCATCRAEREERDRNPLHVLGRAIDPRQPVTARGAELVGSYALRLEWNDGHNTGIYDFALLRGLCPCGQCAGAPRA